MCELLPWSQLRQFSVTTFYFLSFRSLTEGQHWQVTLMGAPIIRCVLLLQYTRMRAVTYWVNIKHNRQDTNQCSNTPRTGSVNFFVNSFLNLYIETTFLECFARDGELQKECKELLLFTSWSKTGTTRIRHKERKTKDNTIQKILNKDCSLD